MEREARSMRATPLILVVDDEPVNRDILQTRLVAHEYEVITASDGRQALAVAKDRQPDLILLDVNMPEIDGFEVCRLLKADETLPYTPIILVTARAHSEDVVTGLDAGAEEYLTKPVDHAALVARVRSMLRTKELHDTVQRQAIQLADWNRTLEQRVQDQIGELERVGRLKRFLSPQLAEALVSSGGEKLLESHRREITVVFCDLRGFTAFSESVDPEELMEVLRNYHSALGSVIFRFEGTLEHFAGDGLMVFFNDPHPMPDHTRQALRMAVAMRHQMRGLSNGWRERGHQLGFAIGIARGFATMGMIGYEGRIDYGAIGPVSNLASRLCDEAKDGQILVGQYVLAEVGESAEAEPVGELTLKGFKKAVRVFNVLEMTDGE